MTKRLILMRHAKSDWTHGLEDHERPLNERGWKAAKMMGNWLKLNDYEPDQIFCSDAARTRETLDRLKLDIDALYLQELYLAEPETLLATLRKGTGQTVLMIAHNPGIAWFGQQMLSTLPDHPRFSDYPTCATLVVDFDIDDWATVEPGTGKPVDFIVPKELY